MVGRVRARQLAREALSCARKPGRATRHRVCGPSTERHC